MITVLGNGIYSYSEAARLLGVAHQQVSGWFRVNRRGAASVLPNDYAELEIPAISFLDLVEASVAQRLRMCNVKPARIRQLHDALGELWDTPHPFSRKELYVDSSGQRIFSHLDERNEVFLEVLAGQQAMPEVLVPILRRVEYDAETSLANRLWPMSDLPIVIDPRRRYGKPIVDTSGLPTSILYECFLANEGSYDFVAEWYNVTPEEVKHAVQFETTFSGIAA